MNKNLIYGCFSLILIFFLSAVFGQQNFTASAQQCVFTCTSADVGNCCVTATGETGTCEFDPFTSNYECTANPAQMQKKKGCSGGKCVEIQGLQVDLCQSDAVCVYKVCEGNSCVPKNAPGPGISPNQCQTNADCAYPLPPTGPRDPKEGERTPTNRTQPNQPAGGTGVSISNPIGPGTFQELVERIARYLFQIGIPIAVIMILYAAFLYLTAGGSEEKVSKAHKALTYAVVGLGILFLAWGITSLVKELLGGQ